MLIDFLKSILKIDIKKVILEKEISLPQENIWYKYGILDLKAILDDGIIVDIEMQMVKYSNVEKIPLYYSSKLVTGQLKKGQDYNEIKPVIVIFILNHKMFEFEEYITCGEVRIKEHPDIKIIKEMKYYFIELPKFREKYPNMEETINQWLVFIDGEEKELVKLAEKKNGLIKKASYEREYLTGDAAIAREAELIEKDTRDKISIRRAGFEDGKAEGIGQEIDNMIKRMYDNGISIDEKVKISNVKLERVKEIIQKQI